MTLPNVDRELADKVVALGIGRQDSVSISCEGVGFYCFDEWSEGMVSELFVRDWCVAGALMEECQYADIDLCTDGRWRAKVHDSSVANPSLPRAIIEACVEALDD